MVGSPIANRNRVETEALIGFFVNTLVLRADLSEDPGFQRLLVQVREVTLEAYAHQDLPFEKLVEELAPQRSLSYTPIFQVVFVLQNAPLGSLELPGLRLEPVPVETGQAKFDLTLSLAESDAGAAGSFEYRTELFDAATIARLAAQWPVLLEGLAADPDLAVGDLPLMPAAERQQVLSMGTATAYPRETCIQELFVAQAAERPEAVALVWDAGTVTYGELDRWSNRIAHRLRDLGVGPESLVGVLLERGAELVAVLLGILKAGGAYLPLDPTYPLERLERLAAAAGVLVARGPAAVALAGGRQVVDLGQAEALARCPDSALNVPVCADGLAYVMFTSGTTGVPKGIAVPHRGVVRLVRETSYAWFGPEEVFLHMAPISFDASTFEVWGALLHGARVALLAERTPSLAELGRGLERHGVTTLWLTSGLFHQVVDTCPWILRGLRQLLAGGDALSLPHVRRALAELPGVRLINGYGPTEGTTFTCCAELSAAPCRFSVPIGRPIANTRIYLVDRRGRAVPVGAPGELWIGGDGLARGYLGRADLTAERFVPDVFGGSGERLYRTGDLGRRRADGDVEFLGRIDQQVKVRGFRIEPGEIEAALLRSPAVEQAVVTVREDRSGDKRLVAYLVFRPGEALSAGSLRDLLAAQLPPYMVPAAFVVLDRLPLTPNGKVDRKALPAPEAARGDEKLGAPRTPVEELVAGIFAEVLGLERVGLEESFFELGGHSLLATQVVSRLREAFGVELPLRELFAAPTVTELAAKVEALRAAGPVLQAPPLVRQDRATALPLSFAQQRLWFLDRFQPGSAAYNIAASVRLEGALNGAALERSLSEIVARHEALRTRFVEAGGQPAQRFDPPSAWHLARIDLRELCCGARQSELARLAGGDAARSFDLQRGPVFRATLVDLGEGEAALLLTMHHIVSDGWSMGVLLRELGALYAAFAAGEPSPLAELPVQYADYAVWQRAMLQGEALERQLAYWRDRLAGALPLDLPTDRPRPAMPSFRGGRVPVALGPELSSRLCRLARREGCTPFMMLLAGFAALLARYSGQEEVSVGTPVANRGRREIESLIGFFVNTLVLRGDLAGDPAGLELLRRSRETALGAYAHQEVPFEKLVEELRPERDLGRTPLVQVLLALQNVPMPALELGDVRLTLTEPAAASVKFDLTLALAEVSGGIAGSLEYAAELFDAATALRMAGHLTLLLDGLVAAPGRRLSELPLLTPEERRQVLVEWTRTEAPPSGTVQGLFEAQVARTPEATAVVWREERLTYAELNRRANRVAHGLRALGVGPETRVAVCMERTPELLSALLGVLKAGGAYVPLDPAYPAERLRYMTEDSRAAMVLTREEMAKLAGPESDPEPWAQPGNLAYVIYTSGSTGRPKGVAIEHRSASALAHWSREVFTAGELAGVLASTSVCFDLSVFELFVPLAWGGAVLLAEDVLELPRLPAAGEVRLVNTVPSAMMELARQGAIPLSVRTVNLAGEPLPRPLVDRLYEQGVGRVVNLYGPSEDTTYSTLAVPARGDSRPPAIGRPISGTRAYLLDRSLNPVPVGVPGELLLGGAGLARGYLGRPELTAEKLVPDPFTGEPGGRLYRTGDLVRYRPDGEIDFLGRIDHQVKVRGFRIELGEIEAALLRHPQVRDAAALVREDRPGDRRIVAFVAGDQPQLAELRGFLGSQLPAYMVPSAVIPLAVLPLTANGKVDRRALARLRPKGLAAPDEHVPPSTPLEHAQAAIWAEILGCGTIGIHDNFFGLGGHSLLATQLVARYRDDFQVEIPLRTLFEAPTIAALGRVLETARERPPETAAGPVIAKASRERYRARSFFGSGS